MSAALEEILAHYGIGGNIVGEKNGPLLRLVEFAPAPGTKIKNVLSAREDIARELGVSSVDVEKCRIPEIFGSKYRTGSRGRLTLKPWLTVRRFRILRESCRFVSVRTLPETL